MTATECECRQAWDNAYFWWLWNECTPLLVKAEVYRAFIEASKALDK